MRNNMIVASILVVSLSFAGCARVLPKRISVQESAAEKGALYEELGTAYTKAGLYDQAIEAYKNSLVCDPNNADIHYYLGLLYQKSNKDVEKAVFHFKRYLYLKPDAKNREDVRYLIEMVLNKR
ncbi:MAG: tetratricopeptide repeat protein [Candidatus Omnitrophica bacterium]|nr:tetratricopeptide repeat protein [Candidatus Omnitrophota bacterium]